MDKKALLNSAEAGMKAAAKDASTAAGLLSKGDVSWAIDAISQVLSGVENAIAGISAATKTDAGVKSVLFHLRSDLRLWKHDIEDAVKESSMSAQLAAEVLEGGDYSAEIAVNSIILELMRLGMLVAMDPNGQPNRQSGIYVAETQPVFGPNSGQVDLRLVKDGKWHLNRIVQAADYLKLIKGLPRGTAAKDVFNAGKSFVKHS